MIIYNIRIKEKALSKQSIEKMMNIRVTNALLTAGIGYYGIRKG
jgi:hypothetical protein